MKSGVAKTGRFLYNGEWRSYMLLCRRFGSCIGARGAGDTLRPAFIYLIIPFYTNSFQIASKFSGSLPKLGYFFAQPGKMAFKFWAEAVVPAKLVGGLNGPVGKFRGQGAGGGKGHAV